MIIVAMGVITGFFLSEYRTDLCARKFFLLSLPDWLFNIGTKRYENPKFKDTFVYIQLLRSDNENEVWNKLIDKYNDKILNNIIFITDKNGKILKYFNPPKDDWAEFKSFILMQIKGIR